MKKSDLSRLVGRGFSFRRLAKEFGCSVSSIRYWLKKYELKTLLQGRVRIKRECIFCGNVLSRRASKYCSITCQQKKQWKKKKEDILNNGIVAGVGIRTLKKIITEVHGVRCSVCGRKRWLDQPIPLILDHVDGNANNNELSNLRLVCGNCDMLLPTYKSKNRGHGRHVRRERYREGRSY